MKRKVCVVTGSRADYGHLLGLMQEIQNDREMELQVAATGMHLSVSQGLTFRNIEKDGFKIHAKVHTLIYSDSEAGITKSIGLGCQLFADTFARLKPDVVVVLGDRFEIFAAAVAAYVAKIPVAHIYGGETSQGAMDEGFRHAVTKMASVHFVSTEEYRKRVIQLGEHPKSVFYFGAPSLETLSKIKLMPRKELLQSLGFPDSNARFAIFTYHPVTLEKLQEERQITGILNAVRKNNLSVVFTKANTDTRGSLINKSVENFCKSEPKRYKLFDFLGQMRYFSCLKHFDLMIGNSSSGIMESASFKLPVINIGDRQKGRVRAKNVIDVQNNPAAVSRAVKKAISKSFLRSIKQIQNPYVRFQDGRTSWRIKEKIKSLKINDDLLKKIFYNRVV